jgi:hypothetical protein
VHIFTHIFRNYTAVAAENNVWEETYIEQQQAKAESQHFTGAAHLATSSSQAHIYTATFA